RAHGGPAPLRLWSNRHRNLDFSPVMRGFDYHDHHHFSNDLIYGRDTILEIDDEEQLEKGMTRDSCKYYAQALEFLILYIYYVHVILAQVFLPKKLKQPHKKSIVGLFFKHHICLSIVLVALLAYLKYVIKYIGIYHNAKLRALSTMDKLSHDGNAAAAAARGIREHAGSLRFSRDAGQLYTFVTCELTDVLIMLIFFFLFRTLIASLIIQQSDI
ncbi:hypothetical protein ACJX0J_033202, partial [Zea mays]